MDNFLTNVPFTTSGALVDIVDKKILVSLRDGKKLIGVLRSYDQFANLVLQDTIERIHVRIESEEDAQQDNQTEQDGSDNQRTQKNKTKKGICKYTDVWRGIYLVRGENVVLLGEIDLDKEDEIIKQFECDTVETVSELQRQEVQRKTDRVKKDEKILFDRLGFSKEGDEDDRY